MFKGFKWQNFHLILALVLILLITSTTSYAQGFKSVELGQENLTSKIVVQELIDDLNSQLRNGVLVQSDIDNLSEELASLNKDINLNGLVDFTDIQEIVILQRESEMIVETMNILSDVNTARLEIETDLLHDKLVDALKSIDGLDSGIQKPDAERIEISFKDVKSGHWFYETVTELVARGGIDGYKNGTFKPNNPISFSEFLMMSMRAATGEQFPADNGKHWASSVHSRAIKEGIIIENEFPGTTDVLNKAISREDMTMVLLNINLKIQGEPSVNTENTKYKIKDFDKISPNRRGHVIQAYEKGLIQGLPGGGFDPQGKTSRAEAATVLLRALDHKHRVEAPEGPRILSRDNLVFDPKVGDIFVKEDGTRVELKKQWGILAGGQGLDLFSGMYFEYSDTTFKEGMLGLFEMKDTITGRTLGGQPYWSYNGEAHFRTDWMIMGNNVMEEFRRTHPDRSKWKEGAYYMDGWVVIVEGGAYFTGYEGQKDIIYK